MSGKVPHADPMVISSTLAQSYTRRFQQCQKDGFIQGADAPSIFAVFQLPNQTLARIWQQVDASGSNKLGLQAFMQACHLAQIVAKTGVLPPTLPVAPAATAPEAVPAATEVPAPSHSSTAAGLGMLQHTRTSHVHTHVSSNSAQR